MKLTLPTMVALLIVAGASSGLALFAQETGADLTLSTMSISRPEARAGETVVYGLVAKNDGPEPADGVSVLDRLPDTMIYVADDGGGNYDPVSGQWAIRRLEPGENARLLITATVVLPPVGPSPSGTVLGEFVASGTGGLSGPVDLAYGVDGDLYVSSADTDEILRYDGASGASKGAFVVAGAGGLDGPDGIVFGPSGNLYVASVETDAVLRYDGVTGALDSVFVAAGAGGLDGPSDLVFTSEGDLLVASSETGSGAFATRARTAQRSVLL